MSSSKKKEIGAKEYCYIVIWNLSCVTYMFRYYIGTHIFPEVLLNDIAGPDGNSLLLSLKLAVDVLVSVGSVLVN